MSATIESEARIIASEFRLDPMDDSLGTVRFVVEAGTPHDARRVAASHDLASEGLRIARQGGLELPGLSDRGVVRSCNRDGVISASPFEQYDPEDDERMYCCTVTHAYRGTN